MIKIDTTSNTYDFVANLASTIVGIGAGALVGTLCNNIMDSRDFSISERNKMALGRIGFKTVAIATVSNEFRKNLDDVANGWNEIVDILEGAKKDPDPIVVNENAEVVNG